MRTTRDRSPGFWWSSAVRSGGARKGATIAHRSNTDRPGDRYSQFVTIEETPPPKAPWVQTTAGVIIINGVVTAVVSSVVTAIINNAGTLPWNSIFLTFGVVAVATFMILSLARRQLRDAIWARPARWLWSLRLVTVRRQKRELDAANKRVDDLARNADLAIGQLRTSIEKVALNIATQLGDSKERVDTIMNAVEDLDEAQKGLRGKLDTMVVAPAPTNGDEDTWALPSAMPSSPPAPAPRWRLVDPRNRTDQHQDDGKFILQNLVANSIALNVRLDNNGVGQFEFEDGAFWPEVSGVQTVTFSGAIVESDREGDVRLSLDWLDENNHRFTQLYWLNRDGRFRQIYPDQSF